MPLLGAFPDELDQVRFGQLAHGQQLGQSRNWPLQIPE
jgi:hypothetical protein